MAEADALTARRTSVDDVYDYLHTQISTLQLKPGDRISEADAITKARFVRAAIEKEVLSRAASFCDAKGEKLLDAALKRQHDLVKSGSFEGFGPMDYEFHKTLCAIARADFAFDVILEEKAKVDRLCMLGIDKEQRIPDLVADHQAIADAIKAHDAPTAIAAGMVHLSRLDETVERIRATNANYFENKG